MPMTHEVDAKDAARYRWLKAENRKPMPLGTISWRLQGNSLPCHLSYNDDLDKLIDTAIANPDASVQKIYQIATGGFNESE